ncbi:MAG TPA: 2-oxoglutarate dehydrogenase complex dihydrolipoyllysine-residue succinyltransferase [Alphaproteobacteria bacterium]|nr:2-oxoglutarate dehydrogenase complex dihydrolipoyllysine-residue succinyltransferase [Alphaproteobacteria bacterium]
MKLVELKVPSLGESVVEATLAKWLKKEGDAVHQDEVILELETDKVTLEVSAPVKGVLKKCELSEGMSVQVGGLLGLIEEGAVSTTSAVSQETSFTAPPLSSVAHDPFILASSGALPAAKKMMEENNVKEADIKSPSGKDGRITKGDVIETLAQKTISPPQVTALSDREEKRVAMSRLRQRVAERLKGAQNTAAILTTFNEVDMSALQKARGQYKDMFEKKHGVKLGFMSFFVKACIQALKEIPAVNGEIQGTDILYKNYYDISVAVSAPQGLVVPVIRDADLMSFSEIEKQIGNLGKKAKDGKLTIEDLTGGTFTISNGGVFGSLLSTPIINPPQSAILGMHKIQERPVAINGQVVIRPMMYVALSYDHRLVDGREAVTFLVRVKECLENPERLLLEI